MKLSYNELWKLLIGSDVATQKLYALMGSFDMENGECLI